MGIPTHMCEKAIPLVSGFRSPGVRNAQPEGQIIPTSEKKGIFFPPFNKIFTNVKPLVPATRPSHSSQPPRPTSNLPRLASTSPSEPF